MANISLGERKVRKVNYSHGVFLPSVLLNHLGVEANDFVEFVIYSDGSCHIMPVKKEALENAKKKVR